MKIIHEEICMAANEKKIFEEPTFELVEFAFENVLVKCTS